MKGTVMHIVVGPVLTRKGGYAFDCWAPEQGLSVGYTYRRVEDAPRDVDRRYGVHLPRLSQQLGAAVQCAVARAPLDHFRLAVCGGSPCSCQSVLRRAFCCSLVNFVPARGLEQPVWKVGGEGSVQAPRCSSIRTPARDVQFAIPGQLGQSATIGLSRRLANVTSRKAVLKSLQRLA